MESYSDLLQEFLEHEAIGGIDYIAPEDLRTIMERYLRACRELGYEAHKLEEGELRAVMETSLPALYSPAEPIGQRTIDVLRTFLTFLEPRFGRDRSRALGVVLEDCAEPFRARIRGE